MFINVFAILNYDLKLTCTNKCVEKGHHVKELCGAPHGNSAELTRNRDDDKESYL